MPPLVLSIWRSHIFRFAVVGASVGFAGAYVLKYVVDQWGWQKDIANFIVLFVSVQLNFMFNDFWTYQDRQGSMASFTYRLSTFNTTRFVSLILNQILFSILVRLGFTPFTSFIICLGVITIVNYFFSDRLVFMLAKPVKQ